MENCVCMLITAKEGPIPGGQKAPALDSSSNYFHVHEIGVEWNAPLLTTSGAAVGNPEAQAMQIVTDLGSQSPRLMQAITSGEVLQSVEFSFHRTTQGKKDEVYHKITLEGARLVQFKIGNSHNRTPNVGPHIQTIGFAYTKLQQQCCIKNIVADCQWSHRSS